jgi:FAD dependent oxidoreductase TIGR03364
MRVVVVGGGILGTMHALEAHRRGHEVVQLERERAARGASVRNFGLVWVSGRAVGAELDLALRARRRWGEIGHDVPGIGFRPHGSITTAQNPAELDVLTRAVSMADAQLREFELLDPDAVAKVNPALAAAAATGSLLGGLWCRQDAIVEPRDTCAAIARRLSLRGRYTLLTGRTAVESSAHTVRDQTGEVHTGDLVVLCPGAEHSGLAGTGLATAAVRRVRLQMLQTEPYPVEVTTSIADGDSLRYYPAYADAGSAGLPPPSEMTARWHSQLLLVQRLDGSLTIGDTHAYDEPFDFDLDEAPGEDLRGRAEVLLGQPLPPTRRRWAGVYSQVTDDALCHRAWVAPGVVVVTGAGGRGMTCSPAIAEDTFEFAAAAAPTAPVAAA